MKTCVLNRFFGTQYSFVFVLAGRKKWQKSVTEKRERKVWQKIMTEKCDRKVWQESVKEKLCIANYKYQPFITALTKIETNPKQIIF